MSECPLKIAQVILMKLALPACWCAHLLSWDVLIRVVAFTCILERICAGRSVIPVSIWRIRCSLLWLCSLEVILECSSLRWIFVCKIIIRVRFLKIIIKHVIILRQMKAWHVLFMRIILLLIDLWCCGGIVGLHVLLVEGCCLTRVLIILIWPLTR